MSAVRGVGTPAPGAMAATRARAVGVSIAFGLLALVAEGTGMSAATAPESVVSGSGSARTVVLDDFTQLAAWTAAPADGVSLEIVSDAGPRGRAMRLDFDFRGHAGYAIARRRLELELPENYAFSFWVRGDAPPNDLELKLVDPSGDNVWWANQRRFEFPSAWRRIVLRKRRIVFAWGPAGGGELKRTSALELAITAGSGGRGSVWIADIELTPLPPEHEYRLSPRVTASVSAPGREAPAALDGDLSTAWSSGPLAPPGASPGYPRAGDAQLTVDFQEMRPFGGIVVDWGDARATVYDVETSDDGSEWTLARSVRKGEGPRDWLALPETDARYLRLRLKSGPADSYAIREIEIRGSEFGESPTAFFNAIARASPRGAYPRYWLEEQVYWTVVGVSGGLENALFNEDGALEIAAGGASIEPFVEWGGKRMGWEGVARNASLLDGDLPIPTVTWTAKEFTLEITALADGPPAEPTLHARYRLTNRGQRTRRAALLLALRPFQVNPPWQFLGTPGGAARVSDIVWGGGPAMVVNGSRRVILRARPDEVAALAFDAGDAAVRWLEGREPWKVDGPPRDARLVPDTTQDPVGRASAAFLFRVPNLAPGSSWETEIAVPLTGGDSRPSRPGNARPGPDPAFAARLEAVRRIWREAVDRVRFRVPARFEPLARTARSNLAFTLINRSGPAIRPGSRAYARSWIRDGALSASALLRLGHADEARAFAVWFAGHQYDDGKVPCCVDARGADPVPENDSHGELIHLIGEVWRYTGDRAFLDAMWPHVDGAVRYIDRLRHQRRTEAYRAVDKLAYFGLLPESISHEGYSDKPRHSYWDDFFALTGLDDAVEVAAALGRSDDRARIARIRDELREDLLASVGAAMKLHGIDYVPGCVELGDFDPTSTTVALDPAGLLGVLPRSAVERTFEKYLENFLTRRDGAAASESYTPYELRTVGAFVRLGWIDRAQESLAFFLRDRRPQDWNAWAEVVWRDPKTPRFVGDIPHTWVGTDFIRSFLDLFAYPRPADGALVVAAGIPDAWATSAGGVGIRGLRTPWGPLTWSLSASENEVRLRVEEGCGIPPGGIVFVPSRRGRPESVSVNRKRVIPGTAGEIVIRALPADVRLKYGVTTR